MRSSIIALMSVVGVVGCERAPQDAPREPAKVTPRLAPAPPAISMPRPIRPPVPALANANANASDDASELDRGVPQPPSLEPKAYAAWLRALPAAQQRRIAAVCRANRRTYVRACGGIGPLHIPYPPYPRASVRHPHSLYASAEAWQAALSPAQRRYLERMCDGGEDQPSSDLCGDNTPLIAVFDDRPVAFTPASPTAAASATFAFAPGHAVRTDWPDAATPWLARDRDHDGAITSGAELFGNHTALADDTAAVNGFVALAALDDNHDGRLDAADAAFASLQLWADRDGDRRSAADELRPLSRTIVSISLDDRIDRRCDARGNCLGERAAMVWRDDTGAVHAGAIVDVYLPTR